MLKKYKNQLFNIVEKSSLDLSYFEYEERKEAELPVFIIKVKNSPLRIEFKDDSNLYYLFHCSAVYFGASFPMHSLTAKPEGFSEIILKFKYWFENHAIVYIENSIEPDLWEQYFSKNKFLDLTLIDFEERDFFDEEEKHRIKLALNDIKILINKTFKPGSEEQKSTDEKLEYLKEALDRLNKFEWKSVLTSTIFNISIALSLDTEKGKQLFNIVKKVFSAISKLVLGN